MTRRDQRTRRGFTVIETALSTVVIGLMLVAALQTVGASKVAQHRNADRARAVPLASSLLAEITAQAYEEPDIVKLFGPEPTEVLTGNRSAFDDVDDYEGLTETPPRDRAGVALPGFTGWTLTVKVQWVNPSNPTMTSLVETGAKLITVTATRDSIPYVRLHSIRTSAR